MLKKLVCELCGSNAFTKDDDQFFVCDYCRTKYTVEQARALMDGATVSLDRRSEADAVVRLARRLRERDRSSDDVMKHVTRAIELDPENAEAWQLKGILEFERTNGAKGSDDLVLAREFASPEQLPRFRREEQETQARIAKFIQETKAASARDWFLVGGIVCFVFGLANSAEEALIDPIWLLLSLILLGVWVGVGIRNRRAKK